jgi:hypothetical protein
MVPHNFLLSPDGKMMLKSNRFPRQGGDKVRHDDTDVDSSTESVPRVLLTME